MVCASEVPAIDHLSNSWRRTALVDDIVQRMEGAQFAGVEPTKIPIAGIFERQEIKFTEAGAHIHFGKRWMIVVHRVVDTAVTDRTKLRYRLSSVVVQICRQQACASLGATLEDKEFHDLCRSLSFNRGVFHGDGRNRPRARTGGRC